jgi:hypothetical protein
MVIFLNIIIRLCIWNAPTPWKCVLDRLEVAYLAFMMQGDAIQPTVVVSLLSIKI